MNSLFIITPHQDVKDFDLLSRLTWVIGQAGLWQVMILAHYDNHDNYSLKYEDMGNLWFDKSLHEYWLYQ